MKIISLCTECNSSRRLPLISLGVVGVCYVELKIFAASFFLFLMFPLIWLSLPSMGLLEVVHWFNSLRDMLIEGVYSVIDTLARQGF